MLKTKQLSKTKIILVDDHQVVRAGIMASLLIYDDIEIIDEANNAKELISKLETTIIDTVILDISMPDMTGIEACKIVKEKYPFIKVLIFTGTEDENDIFEALQAGTDAFLPKDADSTELIKAIRTINKGNIYLSKLLPSDLMVKYMQYQKQKEENILTERETEILKHIAEGLPYKEIANKLFISAKTVEKHKRNISEKLNLTTTSDIIRYAIKNKIIKL